MRRRVFRPSTISTTRLPKDWPITWIARVNMNRILRSIKVLRKNKAYRQFWADRKVNRRPFRGASVNLVRGTLFLGAITSMWRWICQFQPNWPFRESPLRMKISAVKWCTTTSRRGSVTSLWRVNPNLHLRCSHHNFQREPFECPSLKAMHHIFWSMKIKNPFRPTTTMNSEPFSRNATSKMMWWWVAIRRYLVRSIWKENKIFIRISCRRIRRGSRLTQPICARGQTCILIRTCRSKRWIFRRIQA